MAFRLRITSLALADIDGIVAFVFREHSPSAAADWLDGIESAAQSLVEMPRSLPLAPEHEEAGFEVRHNHYQAHRLLFTIEEDIVIVPWVYHGARKRLRSDDLTR